MEGDDPLLAVRQFIHDHAGGVTTRLSAGLGAGAQALSSCYALSKTDAQGDTSGPDVVTYRLGSDCSTWALDVGTDAGWRASEVELFGMRIDIDYDRTTGCLGGDFVAGVIYDAGLQGAMIRTPQCDDATWSSVGGIAASKPSTDTVALSFPASMISSDTSFRWYLGFSAVNGGVDFAPDRYWVAINPQATAPTAPRSLTATPGRGLARLTWQAPSSPGGTAISDYVVQRSADGGRTWRTLDDGRRTGRHVTASGLTNGRRYRFRVAAVNRAGRGPWSAPVIVVPATVPTAPRQLSSAGARRAVRLRWQTPSSNGGAAIRDYIVQRSANGGRTWRTVPDGVRTRRAATVTSLTVRKRHVFRVAAVNRAGRGAWSAVVRGTPR